jgi:hypothetical protein
MKNLKFILLLFCAGFGIRAMAQSTEVPNDPIYQYETKVGTRTAYLWLPSGTKHVFGVIVALSNLLEKNWLEDQLIRKTAAKHGLGIIWLGPALRGDETLTADMKPGMDKAFQAMLDSFATESGYTELSQAFVLPTGHSANGHFAWTFARACPDRTIACIPVKTVPFPAKLELSGIPVCYIVGETTEWPQYRVADPVTKPGDRDFFWPVVRTSAINIRKQAGDNLIAVVTDPGGGHFDWSKKLSAFMSLYIDKACQYRLPAMPGLPLKRIHVSRGWLTGTGGMKTDSVAPAEYLAFKGDKSNAYWFFDQQTAQAAYRFEGDRVNRKKQLLTFVQDGKPLSVTKLGYAPLKFQPDTDGVTFHLVPAFLDSVPPELIGAGQPLQHAPGSIHLQVISGPAVQIGPVDFRIRFHHDDEPGDIWIEEEHSGDQEFRHAVQPGKVTIPQRLNAGQPQVIVFEPIPDITPGTKTVKLQAHASSGLPVSYYINSGPAYVSGNEVRITAIPLKARYPVQITVTAYQWGRAVPPLFQSALPVKHTFHIRAMNDLKKN